MPTALSLKPFIPSGPDFDRAKAFFLDLGFAVAWQADGYAELQLGTVSFILQRLDSPEMQRNMMMLVIVDDLDAWWRHVQQCGIVERYGVAARPPTVFPWGQREVHVIDPAGVCWHFAG